MKIITGLLFAVILSAPALAHEEPSTESHRVQTVEKKVEAKKPAAPTKHSGGTDSKGCHMNHSTGVYHCHNPK